jgi:hypothetical protein
MAHSAAETKLRQVNNDAPAGAQFGVSFLFSIATPW